MMMSSHEMTEEPNVSGENGTDSLKESENTEGSDMPDANDEALENLKKQLEECQTQSDNYLDQWRRTAAEFANYKKRSEREQAEATKYCNASLITRLLPILDDMDRAFQNLPGELQDHAWVKGMALVHHKFHAIFEQEGVRKIETEGQEFDPALHEALTHEPDESVPEGMILGEIEKGYVLNDRVLRAAKVRVSSG